MSHPPPDRSQGIRKLCGTAIIPRLTAIHRPIYRAVNGRRKIELFCLKGERWELNPRMVVPQTTALTTWLRSP